MKATQLISASNEHMQLITKRQTRGQAQNSLSSGKQVYLYPIDTTFTYRAYYKKLFFSECEIWKKASN